MSSWFKTHPLAMGVVGLSMGLLVGVGMMIGTLVTVNQQNATGTVLPETILNASASHSGQTFAMATGPIDGDIEALFMLDYLTGELTCSVIHTRTAQFFTQFKYNVIQDLGVQQGKQPDYVMVTGQAAFVGRTGGNSPASTVVYVADGNTGNFAAYGIVWNRTIAQSGAPTGAFTPLGKGMARALPSE